MPFFLGIVGRSDTGKTTLILKLLPELEKRGYRVGVAKNCPHGFDFDREGKDSWKFYQGGASGVLLTSPCQVAFLKKKENKEEGILDFLSLVFHNFDLVLIEGFREESKIKKVELLRKGVSERPDNSLKNVVAFVSDLEIEVNKPVFKPEQIYEIADFMERLMEKSQDYQVEIIVNGERLPLNFFVKKMIGNLAFAVVDPLKREDEKEAEEIIIKVKRLN